MRFTWVACLSSTAIAGKTLIITTRLIPNTMLPVIKQRYQPINCLVHRSDRDKQMHVWTKQMHVLRDTCPCPQLGNWLIIMLGLPYNLRYNPRDGPGYNYKIEKVIMGWGLGMCSGWYLIILLWLYIIYFCWLTQLNNW